MLSNYAEEDSAFPQKLVLTLKKLRQLALPEMEERLHNPTTPKSLKRAILEAVPKADWPEWVPLLERLLEREQDLGLFDRGCLALGAIGNRAALEGLRTLKSLRADADRQLILNREMEPFQPIQNLEVYLNRLGEGQGNPRHAIVAGKVLAGAATLDHLPDLMHLHRRGDALTKHLAFRVLDGIPSLVIVQMVLAIFLEMANESQETQLLADLLERSQVIQRTQAREEMLHLLEGRLAERAPQEISDLRAALLEEEADPTEALEALKDFVMGPFEEHLLEAFGLLAENKVARFSGLVAERLEAVRRDIGNYTGSVDAAAESLLRYALAGKISPGELIPAFWEALHRGAGGDGLLIAYARLVPPADQEQMSESLQDPDIDRRRRFIEAVGSREEDAFVPFFLKALNDPILEVGTLAMHHLGKLPSSFPVLLEGFRTQQTDKVRTAIRVWGENHTQPALEPLLAFIQADSRDELVVEAVEAIHNLCAPSSAPVLLSLLHDGKPKNLQIALASALGYLGTSEASLGLLDKAPALKVPHVLILALEGSLSAFPNFRVPFPAPRVPDFLNLLRRCCDEREGEGQRERAMHATQGLYVFDPATYETLKEMFSEFLAELRGQENWDKERTEAISVVIRELTRRCASLAQITEKEEAIRAQLQKVPAQGPTRAEALLGVRESLQDPDLLLRPEFAAELVAFVREGLDRGSAEWRELAHFCQIAGLLGNPDLVAPIREIHLRASGLGLKSATREALKALGLSEGDLQKRLPIRSVLVLEPNGFFQKRLAGAIEGSGRSVKTAFQRAEAEALLTQAPMDLVVSEREDGNGDLLQWLQTQWQRGAFRYALISTSRRDALGLEAPWVIGTFFKPYPMDQLIHALEG